VGIKEGVKDCVGKYSLVVIQVVICSEFCVDVKISIVFRWAPFLW